VSEPLNLERDALLASLGGEEAAEKLDSEAKADALEHHMMMLMQVAPDDLSGSGAEESYPTAEEIEARIETRHWRRGVGNLFVSPSGNVRRLPPLPEKPTLFDYFDLRFGATRNHVLQSAALALKTGMSEEIVLACLLHDTVMELIKTDHGWWGAALYEPYVPEKVSFAIRYHQTLRYYPDPSVGYEYPHLYRRMFGEDYVPPPYIQATYEMVRKHKWYMEPRLLTVNDLYAFDRNAKVTMDPFVDIIGRHFKQPKEGLGFDNSPVAHMWRTISRPDQPL
jgi:hypothetical protein